MNPGEKLFFITLPWTFPVVFALVFVIGPFLVKKAEAALNRVHRRAADRWKATASRKGWRL